MRRKFCVNKSLSSGSIFKILFPSEINDGIQAAWKFHINRLFKECGSIHLRFRTHFSFTF